MISLRNPIFVPDIDGKKTPPRELILTVKSILTMMDHVSVEVFLASEPSKEVFSLDSLHLFLHFISR